MKKFLKQSLMIVMCIAMLSVGYVIGATGKIHTEYSRPNVYVDGTKVEYTYADGTKANAFMSTEWVTYMPVRAIAEALGKEVTTEGNNVYIKSPDAAVSGKTLYEDELVKIVFTGVGKNYVDRPIIKLYIENNSNQDLTIQAEDTSVNGFMVDAVFSADIAAGKKMNDTITLYSIDSNDTIGAIKTFELKFRIIGSSFERLKTTDAISVTVG